MGGNGCLFISLSYVDCA